VKNYFKTWCRPGVAKLCGDDLVEAAVTVKVQLIDPTLQMHGKNQSHQSEIVIAVKMADEYVVDPVEIYLMTHKPHLRSFATVDKEIAALYFHELGSRMPAIGGQCAT